MITVSSAIEQFLVDNELKGNTNKTVNNYRNILGYFMDFIGDINIQELSLTNLKQYHLQLKTQKKLSNHAFKPTVDKPISKTSIQTYIRHIRAFLRWLYDEGYTLENLSLKFKLPKAPKKTVEILSDDEIDKLLNSFNERAEMGLRNKCMLALMVDCGLRRGEVVSLNYDNIHFTQGCIKVFGKGEKERIVPLGLYAKKLLHKYINGYRSMPEYETKKLFITKDLRPINDNVIKQLFTRLRKKVGIDRLYPHILRHTFATKYLLNGGDIFSLQQILGHTSLEMVRNYSHLASSYMLKNHKKLSPLDNIRRQKYNF